MADRHLTIGICAPADAGKTTLAENILYMTGSIRKLGRVDHRDTFLDTYAMEKQRGITVFSKQAVLRLGDRDVTLLDTPGHVDFAAETERSFQVMDYCILLISAPDQVDGHVQTLWKLLAFYQVPVFLFVNKMDQPGTDAAEVFANIKGKLSSDCVRFDKDGAADFAENAAMCDEQLLEEYLEQGTVSDERIRQLIVERRIFPCFFGSALKSLGTAYFLERLSFYLQDRYYPKDFQAKIYKIARDEDGARLTHMKITGGTLKTKTLLQGKDWEDKVEQIRIYSGAAFTPVQEVCAGQICAVTGLEHTAAGEMLGTDKKMPKAQVAPVFSYCVRFPEGTDQSDAYEKMKALEEEIPELRVQWERGSGEIHAHIMGEVQMEILKYLFKERYGQEISFGAGRVIYRETITKMAEGVGHFEPLRHYAEVHLILEPAKPGSGLLFSSNVSTDELSMNWQRLILTHLAETTHPGVLTGADITDMKITVAAGRASKKHTEGGDFRQATYRAVRQGLMKAAPVLLEPYYAFHMELPQEALGRAMNDIQRMSGSFEAPVPEGEQYILTGMAPAAAMHGYQSEFVSYTRGRGVFTCEMKGYYPCHNQEEVVESIGYHPENDLSRPCGSVFCSHGAGFEVPWDEVEAHMHIPAVLRRREAQPVAAAEREKRDQTPAAWGALDKELDAIFVRTYGEHKSRLYKRPDTVVINNEQKDKEIWEPKTKQVAPKKEYLLVDGYNIICAWPELKELAQTDLKSARDRLIDIMCNYQGYRGMTLIVVFDAYKVKGFNGEHYAHNNIFVVYTKEAETADAYIEKTVHELGRKHNVTVATSDNLEQIIIFGQGARRMGAAEFYETVRNTEKEIREKYLDG